jgi:hypothetical protein
VESSILTTRRDPRYDIAPGRAAIEFTDPGDSTCPLRAWLTKISVCGVSFEAEEGLQPLPSGAVLRAEIVVGACRLAGEIVVRDVRSLEDGRIAVGGLFHPATEKVELLLTGLIAGIGAAADAGGRIS